jgi:hypothetical protein
MSTGNPRSACAEVSLLKNDQRLSGLQTVSRVASSNLSDALTVVGGTVGIGLVGALRQKGPLHGNGDDCSFDAKVLPTKSFASLGNCESAAIVSGAECVVPACASQSPHDAKARTASALCSRTQLSSRSKLLAQVR